ncbi:MAG TPA: FAD-dependent oxidoreductase, partial [Chloroflexota bacterium]|nr:FAD-dependent oxidoreductase [Chloroflexota bacterium]
PLLKAKFDGSFQQTPSTYIWSRLKRVSSTREAAGQKERMGYFVGSFAVLVDRLVERIEQSGSTVHTGSPVDQLVFADGRVTGVRIGGHETSLDAVIVTAPLPVLYGLVPKSYRERLNWPATNEYLGTVCGLLLLDRRLTPYYTLNIADDEIPFTGLIETTNLIAPNHVGGYHLVYLPKYVAQDSPYLEKSDEELQNLYLSNLEHMFPAFNRSWVKQMFVFRERFVEPLHIIGRPSPALPIGSGIDGLFLVNNAQIYPELTNCQSSVRHALKALPEIVGEHSVASSTERDLPASR